MGCDIHTYVEQRESDGWVRVEWNGGIDRYGYTVTEPFDWRDYGMYGWLADVRNSSAVPPISQPRGLPDDVSAQVRLHHEEWGWDAHSASWLTVDELLAFDYEATFEDRRYRKQVGPKSWDGAATAEPGDGKSTTYREFLGSQFFDDLAGLNTLNKVKPTRVVFWFDN